MSQQDSIENNLQTFVSEMPQRNLGLYCLVWIRNEVNHCGIALVSESWKLRMLLSGKEGGRQIWGRGLLTCLAEEAAELPTWIRHNSSELSSMFDQVQYVLVGALPVQAYLLVSYSARNWVQYISHAGPLSTHQPT